MLVRLWRTLSSPGALLLYLLTVTLMMALAVGLKPIRDPDVWWISAAGRELLQSGTLQRTNLFSFTDPSKPWLMHEWLLGPLYAFGLMQWGPGYLVGLTVLLLGVHLSLTLVGTLGREPNTAGLLMALVAVLFYSARWLVCLRPTGVALLFPVALAILVFHSRFGLRSALLALLVQLLWSNAHGSFPLGGVLMAVAFVERLLAKAPKAELKLRSGLVLASPLIGLCTPHGIQLYAFVLGYATGAGGDIYQDIHATIFEFRTFWGAFGQTTDSKDLLGLLLATGITGLGFRYRELRPRALLCALLLLAALYQARHYEMAGLLVCVLLTPALARIGKPLALPLSATWITGATTCLSLLAGSGALVSQAKQRQTADWIVKGPAVLPSLSRIPNGANAYIPFEQTGSAIWFGFPRGIRVYYDSRNDCYSPEVLRRYLEVKRAKDASAVENALASTSAVLTEDSRLVGLLKESPRWHLSHAQGGFHLFLAPTAQERSPRVKRMR